MTYIWNSIPWAHVLDSSCGAVLEASGTSGGGAQLEEVRHSGVGLKGDIIHGHFPAHALCFEAVRYALLALTD